MPVLQRSAAALVATVLLAIVVGPSTAQAQNGGTAAVYASIAEPLNTGLYVTAGQDVAFFTEGTWCAAGTPSDGECGPSSGIRPADPDEFPLVLDSAQLGELIGRVRGEDGTLSDWFRIGSGGTWSMPSDGWLEVLFNDQPESYADNSGFILVQAVALSEPYDVTQLDVLKRLFDAQNCLTTVSDAYGGDPVALLDLEGYLAGIPACANTLLEGVDGWLTIWNDCIATDSPHEVCDQLVINWLTQEVDAGGSPKVVWAKVATTKDASHVPYGEPVTLAARFHGDVDVAEVRFTAFYPDWPNAKDAARVSGFDPKETWRTVKVCRPETKGCTWDGDKRSATVTYTWDPSVGEKKRSIQGVPKADPAISLASEKCVPVTLGVDAADATGTTISAPGGKIAQRCDATAEGLARTVYLDPLAPPAAPGGVTLQCERGHIEGGVKWCEPSNLGPITLVWKDSSSNEDGFHIYGRYTGSTVSCDPKAVAKKRAGPWIRLATVSTGATSWRVASAPRTLPKLPRPSDWLESAMEFRVGAYNRADESQAESNGKVFLQTEIFCGP